jgi:hypothetical protein
MSLQLAVAQDSSPQIDDDQAGSLPLCITYSNSASAVPDAEFEYLMQSG